MPLPAVIPVTPSGLALLPVPVHREPNNAHPAGTLARDPFAGLAAASRAHDLDAFLRLAEGG